jgi:hypothetical protein
MAQDQNAGEYASVLLYVAWRLAAAVVVVEGDDE